MRKLILALFCAPLMAQYIPPGGGGSGTVTGSGTPPGLALWATSSALTTSLCSDSGTLFSCGEPAEFGGSGQSTLELFNSGGSPTTPTAGQVPACVTPSGNQCTIAWTTPASGGGNFNGFGMWQLTVPAFSGSNWVNQAGAALISGTNFQTIAIQDGRTANSLAVLNTPCPSLPWTLYALIVVDFPSNAGEAFGGLEVDDGTHYFNVGVDADGSSSAIISAQYSAVSGGSAGTFVEDNTGQGAVQYPRWYYISAASGPTLNAWYSFTGIGTPGTSGGWKQLATNSSGGLSAITNCGMFTSLFSGSYGASTTVLSYAFQSSLTPQ